jgi:glycosyltransferase involved in cell wall biosynthesis
MNNSTALVNIIMPAYNHSRYIGLAIESVLMQKCDFEFRLIISDDCSTDNTLEICKSYQKSNNKQILLIEAQTNRGLIHNYKKLFDHCNAKYIAILESDDYWIDADKLNKQVAIMESDDSIGLVHTRSSVLFENEDLKVNYHAHQSVNNFKSLFIEIMKSRYPIAPLTVCFRSDLLKKLDFNFFLNNNLKTIDLFLWPEFSMHSKFYFLDTITAVYRNLTASESNSSDIIKRENFILSSQKIKLYYLNKYPSHELNEHNVLEKGNYQLAKKFLDVGDIPKARQYSSRLPLNSVKNFWMKFISLHRFLSPFNSMHSIILDFLSRTKQRLKS